MARDAHGSPAPPFQNAPAGIAVRPKSLNA